MASKRHKLFWGSSYDRGLDVLLFMWQDIMKACPDAELHITYGWDMFDKVAHTNPERMKWKDNVNQLMTQAGVFHHGRVGKDKLAAIRKQCGIWAYPTYFNEINCITALECQADGVVPVTVRLGALSETVKSGVLIEGDIKEPETVDKFTKELISLMEDDKRWRKESIKAKKAAKKYQWNQIAGKWDAIIRRPISKPKVSVVTITIREGWWNLMADNLSKQTYPIHEWVIVDDHKDNRKEIVDLIAKKYKLNIKYLRGDKGKRRYGLAAANNIGWKNSEGDLLVYLQDFIVIPQQGVEWLVDLHRHHPNALLAPVDIYYHCKQPDTSNKIDWWNGDTDVIGALDWKNIRVLNNGINSTDNPMDFEMNYGAIPKKVLDRLNGWWEFFDDGFGYDNTELAYRVLQSSWDVIVDDTNIAKCINLWPYIGGTDANVKERNRHQGLPIFSWFKMQMLKGNMPVIRDEKLDKSIHLDFSVPEDVSDEDAPGWTKDHYIKIAQSWKDV